MELSDIQSLMTGFEKSSTRELKIDDHGFHLYLSKNRRPLGTRTNQAAIQETPASPAPVEKAAASLPTIKAPLVGTVYLQPKPDQPAYVKVGDRLHKGDVVCVIEAMKMLTEVKSDHDGVVSSIEVENGDLVEVSQPLFTLKEE